MTLLRLTLSLAIAGICNTAMAEQITCESHGNRAEACGTVQPGSRVRLSQRLSNSPCIEGSTWGAQGDSIWVSNGCRAVFEVIPPYDDNANRGYDGQPDQNQPDQNQHDQDRHDQDQHDQDQHDRRDYRDQDRQQQQYSDQGNDQRNDNYSDRNDQGRDDRDRNDERDQDNRQSGHGEQRRAQARQQCANAASSEHGFATGDVQTNDIRWIGEGRLSLSLDTPDGPLTCIVDHDGNVTLSDER